MELTLEVVLSFLECDETDYESAARLGPAAVPWLKTLAGGYDDVLIASKAVYLASLILGDASAIEIIAEAQKSDRYEIRASAAASLENVADAEAASILLGNALNDDSSTVKGAALSVLRSKNLVQHFKSELKTLTDGDKDQYIRDVASKALESLE